MMEISNKELLEIYEESKNPDYNFPLFEMLVERETGKDLRKHINEPDVKNKAKEIIKYLNDEIVKRKLV